MSTTFNLPDLGEGLTEATVLNWLVAEGDVVEVDQPIVEVETAKSAIEVPSPYAGTVVRLYGGVGEVLEVDTPLITVDSGETSSGHSSSGETEAGALSYREEEQAGVQPHTGEAATSAAGGHADEKSSGSGNVLIGYGTSESSGPTRRRRRARAAGNRPEASAQPQPEASLPASTGQASASTRDTTQHATRTAVRVSSPLVRRLAREHGLRLEELTGSGPRGLIMRADVLAAASSGSAGTTGVVDSADRTSAGVDTAHVDRRTGLAVAQRVAITGIRRTIADNLSRSRQHIPEATVWQDVDVTDLLAARARMKQSNPEATPSLMAMLGRFVVAGLQKYPELSTRIDTTADGGEELVYLDGINLGFAAQTPRGLVVPVVKNAQQHTARGLHGAISDLVSQAREGKIAHKDLTGGTFTVNNYGVFGSDGATPIINHPEVAILGIGRILPRPWVVNGELVARDVTTLTLAFDHRVCDGGTAGGFLNFVATCMQDPASALVDL